MRLWLYKLQVEDLRAQKIRLEKLNLELTESWEQIKRVLHYQTLSNIPAIIQIKLISRHYNDLLTVFFEIEKIKELIT